MHNVTLIATIHSETGKCTSDELYKILVALQPEIIFEELPPNYAEMFYDDSFDLFCVNETMVGRRPPVVPLEVNCVKKFLQNYNAKIIPVDIDTRQKSAKHQTDFSFLFLKFFNDDNYKKLDTARDLFIAREGFNSLNSNRFLDFIEQKEITEKSIIESEIEKDRLHKIHKLFHKEQYDNRENAMLQNIYNYSRENLYNQAVFLIGAEHKKSMMQKIIEYEKLSELKLNWNIYGNR